ncbi:uncharacterized protein LOC130136256 [Syzygium oleosum]|uniref:uncharacterized protein LOC130136256 n=1 Tax=Syzygium oleosum TaxID=219896 RepID=UPI0024BADEEA|nr:uncharacterized protein LOC130136256 [Syzygium oleosum]
MAEPRALASAELALFTQAILGPSRFFLGQNLHANEGAVNWEPWDKFTPDGEVSDPDSPPENPSPEPAPVPKPEPEPRSPADPELEEESKPEPEPEKEPIVSEHEEEPIKID